MFAKRLVCGGCGWATVCGADEAVRRLRLVGHLRRESDPDEGVLEELLFDAAGRMTCPGCKRVGLKVEDPVAESDDEDWQTAKLCEACRKPIPVERLEVFPDAKRCVGCQDRSETGVDDVDEPEFCPRCGSLVELRVSRAGGLTRYRRFCTGTPPCRLS